MTRSRPALPPRAHPPTRLWSTRMSRQALVWALLVTASPATAAKIEYNRDVRPILAENCFACHGPDSAARKASLRLDRREDAVEAKAIVPGDPAKSELIARVTTDDVDIVMPPPKSHKKLTAAQK